ncbi:MAG: hypothetical protein NC299_17480, partial [Lachnospiraceae bacterium]|nr:hypothetical protein [Lachnospiraceae bacterium]
VQTVESDVRKEIADEESRDEKEPTVTLMSDEDEITDNRTERGEDNFSVTQSFIFDNEENHSATKDFALSTGATVSDISEKSLKSGLYGIRVETWESRADEIKAFAAVQNAVETHEWGVHQVVTYDETVGVDEKFDYRSLSEAIEAANGYAKGTKQNMYGDFYKHDGAAVYNIETKKIEHTVGEFDVRSIFTEEVLKANGIDVPDNQTEMAVEETPIGAEDIQQEQSNEIKAGDSFMYRGNVVRVTDDEGLYPDDIVISHEEKMGDVSFAVTENVNAARFAREAKRITSETNERELTEEQPDEREQTEAHDAPKQDNAPAFPTITCEFSESRVFEIGKTYSVAEFDALMKQADDDFVAGKQAQIKKYGSERAWETAMRNARQGDENYRSVADFAGYDKVSYIINMPDGTAHIARQDIGDGYGGAIDYLRHFPKYSEIVPVLEQARDMQNAERKQTEIPVGTKLIDETSLVRDKYETRNTEIVHNINKGGLEARVPITRSDALVDRLAAATEFGLYYAKSDYDVSLVTDGTTNGTSIRLTAHDNSFVEVDMSALSPEEYRTVEILTAQMGTFIAKYAEEQEQRVISSPLEDGEKQDRTDNGEMSVDIKNLAQLKRFLTVGAEFEITSYTRDDVKNQWRRVNDADTTAIYSIRPDAPDDDKTTLANRGRGSHLSWEKASDWEFANGVCTAYRRGTEHTEENRLFSIKVRPRILTQERSEENRQTAEQPQNRNMSDKLNEIARASNTKIDFTITDEHLGEGGVKEKFAANIAAIETLKRIESRNLNLAADMFKANNATPDEQKILVGYVGWGGLSQAFDPNNKAWEKEYRQLKELLTDEEYAAAKGSTLNAHYTTPTVISAIYKGLQNLGFEGGNILEPAMGVGNFFGAMPDEIRKNSHLSGVELDSITGRIAQQLYQNADVQVKGFEKTDFSDNYFDAAVGNVPFGSYTVSDKRYNRENFYIHDYFLAKTLDKLAPGGVAALITTKGTLDKENPKVREYLAKRADLIGAIRLPNTAFKANAGTEVTTDILFLQKREKMAVELPDWCYIAKDNNGVPVNQYFIDHPEMVLGTMKQGLEFSMYGNPNETACVPIEGADLKEQLEAAVANLKTNHAIRKHTEQRKAETGVIPATTDVRNFTFAEVNGKMYYRENNIMTEAADKNGNALTGKALERIRALNELRRTFRTILAAQEDNCSDGQLRTYQKILNAQYDAFVKKYGYINDHANYQVFGKDDDYNSLCALEIVNEETHKVTKSDFFSKRTVKQFTEITHVETPQEALFVSVDTLGKLDIPYMAKLCGKEPDEVIDALKADNLIYLNPIKANPEKPYEGWEEASEYLSGQVRIKLRAAERAAEDNPEMQRNVEALAAVIPQKIEAGDITARIGVHWVDEQDYQKFLQEYAKAFFVPGEPLRRAYNGEYKIPFKGRDTSKAATEIFGTKRMTSLEIFENLLNNRDVVVKDKIIEPDGREHYEINKKETELAQDKASKMKDAFKRWLWEEPERREKYVTRYNELFNSIVGRKYDGSHQTFPGMSPSISLKPHQLDAVAR